MNKKNFLNELLAAEGHSEFVICVFCDIRGFSKFCLNHESPDIGMFIKKFYKAVLEIYFPTAKFAKPTGDGLLMIFPYGENSLVEVASSVIESCESLQSAFPTLLEKEPMVNFKTPNLLGFGVTRGTACRLGTKKTIIDYSGQILNLAARLNDLARPSGIVIDESLGIDIFPDDMKLKFAQKKVYVRGVAEHQARKVYCSKTVRINSSSLTPIESLNWKIQKVELIVKDLLKINYLYNISFEEEPLTHEVVKLNLHWKKKDSNSDFWIEYPIAQLYSDAKGHHLELDMDDAIERIKNEPVAKDGPVWFEIQYIPKPQPAKKRLRS